jgi:hypothetical protein
MVLLETKTLLLSQGLLPDEVLTTNTDYTNLTGVPLFIKYNTTLGEVYDISWHFIENIQDRTLCIECYMNNGVEIRI